MERCAASPGTPTCQQSFRPTFTRAKFDDFSNAHRQSCSPADGDVDLQLRRRWRRRRIKSNCLSVHRKCSARLRECRFDWPRSKLGPDIRDNLCPRYGHLSDDSKRRGRYQLKRPASAGFDGNHRPASRPSRPQRSCLQRMCRLRRWGGMGAVGTSRIQMAREKASAVTMQLIQDQSTGPQIPTSCSA